MKKLFTPSITADTTESFQRQSNEEGSRRPGKRALDFIRSFARSYHYEPRLASLGSMSVN